MRVLIFILFLLITNTFSASTTETEFTKGTNNNNKCEIQCPIFKDGFFGRISNFNYDTGETTCFVYSLQNPNQQLATVSNLNPHCKKDLINQNKSNPLNSNSTAVNSHLDSLRNQILANYTNGGFDKYVNLPKYIVAGLIADDKIIDIPSSVASNQVVLNGGFTNEVNLNYSHGSAVTSADMLSRSKDALTNSVTFVINFLNSSDKILLSFKVSLFLFVVAMSVILIISQKATKKVSQIQDHEDIIEKIIFGILSIMMLFLSINKISTSNGQISQTGYQQIIRPLLYMGISTADKLTETASSSILKYKFSEIGITSTADLQTLEDMKFALNEKKRVMSGIVNLCNNIYKADEIAIFTKSVANNYKYPNSEFVSLNNNTSLNGGSYGFYNKNYLKDENNINKEIPAVSMCFKAEKSENELTAKINDLTKKIDMIQKTGTGKINDKIETITELHYKNVAEFGFVSIGSLATTTMAFNNFSLLREENEQEKVSKVIEKKTEKIREASGYEVSSIANPDDGFLSISGHINSFITEAPYYMIPGASSLQDFIRGLFNPLIGDKKNDNNNGLVGVVTDLIPVKWLKGLATFTVNAGVDMFVLISTLGIMVNLVSIAPLLAIIGASFLVICFYFLSVEVLYVVIPFASIFAFSTGNLDIIKNLVKNTFILAVKPVLIVVSAIMALFVYEMFHSLNEVLVSSMFEPLFMLANDLTTNVSLGNPSTWTNSIKGLGDSAIFLFAKSAMNIVSSLIATFTCFYLVFNGANILLDLLGMKDGGFDVGGIIGDKVEGKSSIQKINTGIN